MASRRSERKSKLAVEPWAAAVLAGPEPVEKTPRRAHAARAGTVTTHGDPTMSAILAGALQASGECDRVTHGFHTYPAGLHPDAARMLVGLGEGAVLDPFCGGGTVLVEAMLAGREALGLDVGAVACLVARARTVRTSEAERTTLRAGARRAAEVALVASRTGSAPPRVPSDVEAAYEPHALVEMAAIAEFIGRDEALRAVFSAIVGKASRREGDTVGRGSRVRPPGTVATLFHAKAREYARRLAALEEATAVGGPSVRARVHREDAREFRERDAFGMVVTSPPYPGVYDYVDIQDLRQFWLDLDDSRAWEREIGARRSFREDIGEGTRQWAVDTNRWVRAASRALKPGGRLVVIVGDGRRPHVEAWRPIDDAARAAGLVGLAHARVERWDAGLGIHHHEHAALWERASG